MRNTKAKKKEPRAFGKIVQKEGYSIEKILFRNSRSEGLRIVGETTEWGIVRMGLYIWTESGWKKIQDLSYGEAMDLEKALNTMRKLLNV